VTAEVVTTVTECRRATGPPRGGKSIGLVPTMGALHAGHLSLLDEARERADRVVVSVFVNPTQFGPGEDYERYPRDLDRDVELASERGADLVFAPAVEEMYPRLPHTRVTMDVVTERYEGSARPGHFDGVLTVVTKLFHIVRPNLAVFGRKDAQQAAAVTRMARDLDFPVEIVVSPTVREPDGLAVSSRNAYLDEENRRRATVLYRALTATRDRVEAGEVRADALEVVLRESLASEPAVGVEYAAIVDPDTFQPVDRVESVALAIVAARVGATRLIDNVVLERRDRPA